MEINGLYLGYLKRVDWILAGSYTKRKILQFIMRL